MSTTALQGLLEYLYGTLTPSNMRWVADHLFEQAEIMQYSEAERWQYEASLKNYWDYNNTLETSEAKGVAKEKIAIAQRMKADGLPVEMIAKYTQLSIEEIENI